MPVVAYTELQGLSEDQVNEIMQEFWRWTSLFQAFNVGGTRIQMERQGLLRLLNKAEAMGLITIHEDRFTP